MTEVSVTRKGQITIPVELRKKYNIVEGSKVEVIDKDGEIVIKKLPSIFDLAGSLSHLATPDEVKKLLDQMRAEDA